MNYRHLGDCLDYYKRWFLRELLGFSQTAAFPMFTDDWRDDDKSIYERLIGVRIIQHEMAPDTRERVNYFRPATTAPHSDADIFLDPDTGFRLPGRLPQGRRAQEYIFSDDLSTLLARPDSTRLIVIYDQSISRGSELDSAELKLRALFDLGYHAFAYCAQVAMLCVSRSSLRVGQAMNAIRNADYLPQDRILATHELTNVAYAPQRTAPAVAEVGVVGVATVS